jgi:tRNA pseudouridine13 synthase
VRDLEPSFADQVWKRRKIHGYTINYYWTQRFGVPGGPKRTHLVGRALLDRDWDTALDRLIELRSPESISAERWHGPAEEFFLQLDPRVASFYLAAHSSFLWNEHVRRTAREAFVEAGNLVTVDGIEFLLPSSTKDAVRLMAHVDSLPYTRYSFTPSGVEQRESSRTTVLQTAISVIDCQADEVHTGRSALTLDFFLPSGSYATSAVHQVMSYELPRTAVPAA